MCIECRLRGRTNVCTEHPLQWALCKQVWIAKVVMKLAIPLSFPAISYHQVQHISISVNPLFLSHPQWIAFSNLALVRCLCEKKIPTCAPHCIPLWQESINSSCYYRFTNSDFRCSHYRVTVELDPSRAWELLLLTAQLVAISEVSGSEVRLAFWEDAVEVLVL